MTADDLALQRVADLIHELQPGSMVQRFVLMVETITEDDRYISGFTAPDQKAWDTLGLLHYGTTYEEMYLGGEAEDEDEDA